jgi:hypothetical protein
MSEALLHILFWLREAPPGISTFAAFTVSTIQLYTFPKC